VRVRQRRRQEVLDAATRVLAKRGYANASVKDVADELGILTGSLYHYIRTKEDLLFWVLEETHRAVEQILRDVTEIEGLDPLERLALYTRRQILYNLENRDRVSIYYQDMESLSADRVEEILGHRRAHERSIVGMIREAQSRELADRSTDPGILANCLFATIIWPYRWSMPKRRSTREAIAWQCARFALSGVVGAAASGENGSGPIPPSARP
jgi:TetR/AcrR family transcriptional regulator, cholesterol catabolism regulator